MVMTPIEIVSSRDPFLLRAREGYNGDIEHGLNLKPWTAVNFTYMYLKFLRNQLSLGYTNLSYDMSN